MQEQYVMPHYLRSEDVYANAQPLQFLHDHYGGVKPVRVKYFKRSRVQS